MSSLKMRRLFLFLLGSVILTAVLFIVAAGADGACHCITPAAILFPYGIIISMGARWEIVSLLATALQFPVYALVFTAAQKTRGQVIVVLVLLVTHGVALAFATRYHYHVV